MAAPAAVVWSYRARADLLDALEYLAKQSADAAAAFLADVETAAQTLQEFPNRGTRVREIADAPLRQLFVGRYRLVYRVEPGAVGIVRLIHGSQDVRRAWRKRRR